MKNTLLIINIDSLKVDNHYVEFKDLNALGKQTAWIILSENMNEAIKDYIVEETRKTRFGFVIIFVGGKSDYIEQIKDEIYKQCAKENLLVQIKIK